MFQRAKRDVAKYGMVSSKQAWAELQEMKRQDDMMRREPTINDGKHHFKTLICGFSFVELTFTDGNRVPGIPGMRFTNSRLGADRSGYGGVGTGVSPNLLD